MTKAEGTQTVAGSSGCANRDKQPVRRDRVNLVTAAADPCAFRGYPKPAPQAQRSRASSGLLLRSLASVSPRMRVLRCRPEGDGTGASSAAELGRRLPPSAHKSGHSIFSPLLQTRA
jgi:hypothetical protein